MFPFWIYRSHACNCKCRSCVPPTPEEIKEENRIDYIQAKEKYFERKRTLVGRLMNFIWRIRHFP